MAKGEVGRSSRTPFKHWVLNTHLGQIAGVLSLRRMDVPARPEPFLCVDLCAGDGSQSETHRSSPAIINHHCHWLQSRGIDCEAVFIEKNENTFDALTVSVDQELFPHKIDLICGDAREFVINPTCDNQAIFVNCDPNSISNMPLADEFSDSLTQTTTMTLTLGCNVEGIKRLPLDKRAEWYEYAERVTRRMPSWHDAILVRLVRDDSQWAYLTRLPQKWSQRQAIEIARKGSQLWPKGVEVSVLSNSREMFNDMLHRLFLTKDEYNAK